MSALGIFHTVVSLIAIAAGLLALARDQHISVTNRPGQLYLATMLITAITAFGIYRTGVFGAGHWLTLVVLLLLGLGSAAELTSWFGRAAGYVQHLSFSLSFFWLMFFAVTETLTHLPPQQPLATTQDDGVLMLPRLLLVVALVAGVAYQLRRQWRLA
jgi:hypothetical protein